MPETPDKIRDGFSFFYRDHYLIPGLDPESHAEFYGVGKMPETPDKVRGGFSLVYRDHFLIPGLDPESYAEF